MKLATIRRHRDGRSTAARINDTATATVIAGHENLSVLLRHPDWRTLAREAAGPTVGFDGITFGTLLPHPEKIVCVGLNYATHIREMGRELPTHPTLFVKFASALTGAYDDVVVPAHAAEAMDYEAELAVIIGRTASQVSEADAHDFIAGYSVINDFTMRDYQYRTLQWDQGKNFDATSGFGPVMVTDYVLGTRIETRVDGEVTQSANTGDLVFGPERLVEYVSHVCTLHSGDVIITGTSGGVGHARTPPRYVQDGQTVEVSIEGIGSVKNRVVVK